VRGKRRLDHAIHKAAVTQTDCTHSDGHACYQRKLSEVNAERGPTPAHETQEQENATDIITSHLTNKRELVLVHCDFGVIPCQLVPLPRTLITLDRCPDVSLVAALAFCV